MVVFAGSGQRRQVGDLREALEQSDFPFRVDLFVWDDMPEGFVSLTMGPDRLLYSVNKGGGPLFR